MLRSLYTDLPENYEVIVVNDACTDNSMKIVGLFPIRVLNHQKNKGPSAARNTGVKAATHDVLIFIDSDIELQPSSLSSLCERFESDTSLLGVNGMISLDIKVNGIITTYVNSSLHFQLCSHGKLVNTSFTSLCILKKQAWELMQGWDEQQNSRYVDDVNTRWYFPPKSVALENKALFRHNKTVYLFGMLKHRGNIGFHFIVNLRKQKIKTKQPLSKAIIHPRYSINTVLSASLIPSFLLPYGWLIIVLGIILNNLKFSLFMYKNHGILQSMLVFPISFLEGLAFTIGLCKGIIYEFFSHRKA
jgi:glycosyltransferase involved in cell wall biosynthesis